MRTYSSSCFGDDYVEDGEDDHQNFSHFLNELCGNSTSAMSKNNSNEALLNMDAYNYPENIYSEQVSNKVYTREK
jgi:hypothetical protein